MSFFSHAVKIGTCYSIPALYDYAALPSQIDWDLEPVSDHSSDSSCCNRIRKNLEQLQECARSWHRYFLTQIPPTIQVVIAATADHAYITQVMLAILQFSCGQTSTFGLLRVTLGNLVSLPTFLYLPIASLVFVTVGLSIRAVRRGLAHLWPQVHYPFSNQFCDRFILSYPLLTAAGVSTLIRCIYLYPPILLSASPLIYLLFFHFPFLFLKGLSLRDVPVPSWLKTRTILSYEDWKKLSSLQQVDKSSEIPESLKEDPILRQFRCTITKKPIRIPYECAPEILQELDASSFPLFDKTSVDALLSGRVSPPEWWPADTPVRDTHFIKSFHFSKLLEHHLQCIKRAALSSLGERPWNPEQFAELFWLSMKDSRSVTSLSYPKLLQHCWQQHLFPPGTVGGDLRALRTIPDALKKDPAFLFSGSNPIRYPVQHPELEELFYDWYKIREICSKQNTWPGSEIPLHSSRLRISQEQQGAIEKSLLEHQRHAAWYMSCYYSSMQVKDLSLFKDAYIWRCYLKAHVGKEEFSPIEIVPSSIGNKRLQELAHVTKMDHIPMELYGIFPFYLFRCQLSGKPVRFPFVLGKNSSVFRADFLFDKESVLALKSFSNQNLWTEDNCPKKEDFEKDRSLQVALDKVLASWEEFFAAEYLLRVGKDLQDQKKESKKTKEFSQERSPEYKDDEKRAVQDPVSHSKQALIHRMATQTKEYNDTIEQMREWSINNDTLETIWTKNPHLDRYRSWRTKQPLKGPKIYKRMINGTHTGYLQEAFVKLIQEKGSEVDRNTRCIITGSYAEWTDAEYPLKPGSFVRDKKAEKAIADALKRHVESTLVERHEFTVRQFIDQLNLDSVSI